MFTVMHKSTLESKINECFIANSSSPSASRMNYHDFLLYITLIRTSRAMVVVEKFRTQQSKAAMESSQVEIEPQFGFTREEDKFLGHIVSVHG